MHELCDSYHRMGYLFRPTCRADYLIVTSAKTAKSKNRLYLYLCVGVFGKTWNSAEKLLVVCRFCVPRSMVIYKFFYV